MTDDLERIIEQGSELIRRVSSDFRQRAVLRRARRVLLKILRTAMLMALSAFAIVVGMMSTGLLFGRGIEGLIAAPLAILAAWSVIVYWSLAHRSVPRAIARADVKELPARTEVWLDEQRRSLPVGAQPRLDSILLRLETLTPQVQALDPQSPAAFEVRRLLAEELPELVRGYQKVPRALRGQPLHGGRSPDRHVIEGLATIDEEIGRMQARLAADDVRALATQQRYLEIKYKGDRNKLE